MVKFSCVLLVSLLVVFLVSGITFAYIDSPGLHYQTRLGYGSTTINMEGLTGSQGSLLGNFEGYYNFENGFTLGVNGGYIFTTDSYSNATYNVGMYSKYKLPWEGYSLKASYTKASMYILNGNFSDDTIMLEVSYEK